MDSWRYEYELYCEKCDLLEIDPMPYDEWVIWMKENYHRFVL